jgi:hypothetical protein
MHPVFPDTHHSAPAWPHARRRSGRRVVITAVTVPSLEELQQRRHELCTRTLSAWDTWRTEARGHFTLGLRAASCAAVGYSLGVPHSVRTDHRRTSVVLARTLIANLFYEGDLERGDADIMWSTDGAVLLWRDARRWGGLLLRPDTELSPWEVDRRSQLLADIRALIPFSLLVANTWPLTPGVLRATLLKDDSWLRGFRGAVLPSSWEETRLKMVQRARALRDRRQRG